jgi:hypothetical protein
MVLGSVVTTATGPVPDVWHPPLDRPDALDTLTAAMVIDLAVEHDLAKSQARLHFASR